MVTIIMVKLEIFFFQEMVFQPSLIVANLYNSKVYIFNFMVEMVSNFNLVKVNFMGIVVGCFIIYFKGQRIVILVLVVSIDFEDFDVFIVSFDGRFINLSLEVTINNYLVIVVINEGLMGLMDIMDLMDIIFNFIRLTF